MKSLFNLVFILLTSSCVIFEKDQQVIEDKFEKDRASFWRSDFKLADGTRRCRVSQEQARSGKSSFKFIVKKGDYVSSSDRKNKTERSEFYLKDQYRDLPGQTVNYKFSFFVPKDFPILDRRLVMGQWIHLDHPKVKSYNPHLSNRFRKGQFYISLKLKKKSKVEEKIFHPPNNLFKIGAWNDLSYQIIFSSNKNGMLKVWLNGKQFVDYKGATANYDLPTTFKCCLYRDQSEEDMVIYFDNFTRKIIKNKTKVNFDQTCKIDRFVELANIKPNTEAPKVTLKYGEVFDSVCPGKTGYKVNKPWSVELSSRLHEFQKIWDEDGPKLLSKSSDIVGKTFVQKDFIVTLSLCNFPSMSHPLLINMRYALKSFTKNPISLDVTNSIIHHEILHLYLEDKIPSKSRLLKKYSSEHSVVKSHIHLLALQQAVYLSLKWKTKLEQVKKKDKSFPNGFYKRAWEIVEKEGHEGFINELKQ